MIRKIFGLSLIALAIVGTTCRPSAAQTTTVIQIDIENYVLLLWRQPGLQQTRGDRAADAACVDEDIFQLHRTGGHRQSERPTRQRHLVHSGDHNKLFSNPGPRPGYCGHHA